MSEFNSDIVKKIEQGNRFEDEGRFDEALDTYLDVFNEIECLTDDIYALEETRWLISCIYGVYSIKKDFAKAKEWALNIFKCDIPENATSELIDLGTILYELGEKDDAFNYFSKAYAKGKYRAFQGYEKKYFDFYKSYKN